METTNRKFVKVYKETLNSLMNDKLYDDFSLILHLGVLANLLFYVFSLPIL